MVLCECVGLLILGICFFGDCKHEARLVAWIRSMGLLIEYIYGIKMLIVHMVVSVALVLSFVYTIG